MRRELNKMLILTIIVLVILMFFGYAFLPSNINKQRFFRRTKKNTNVIYLTFDDGPSEYTEELLKLLKQYKVRASFFCVANFAKEHKSIIEMMKQEGHLIALHSLKHKNAMLQGIRETKRDLETSLEIMRELGILVHYYRPPWGDSNWYLLQTLKQKQIQCVLWDVMVQDWEAHTTPEIIANKLLARVKPR